MHGTRTTSAKGVGGFTLIELLIAIGIMGVGLVMAAALFPAALRENAESVNDTLGTMMCENGLRVARIAVTDAEVRKLGVGTQLADITKLIGANDRVYRTPLREFVALARHMHDTDTNDYQVVVVACAKLKDKHTVHVEKLTGSIAPDGDGSRLTVGGGGAKLALRSPVITSDGLYTRIITSSDNVAFLERPLPTQSSAQVWVIYEKDDAGRVLPVSPAMATLVSRNAFR